MCACVCVQRLQCAATVSCLTAPPLSLPPPPPSSSSRLVTRGWLPRPPPLRTRAANAFLSLSAVPPSAVLCSFFVCTSRFVCVFPRFSRSVHFPAFSFSFSLLSPRRLFHIATSSTVDARLLRPLYIPPPAFCGTGSFASVLCVWVWMRACACASVWHPMCLRVLFSFFSSSCLFLQPGRRLRVPAQHRL